MAWPSSIVSSWKIAARPPARRTTASKPSARAARTASSYPGATTSRLAKATKAPGRASRSVSGSSPAPTRSITARETATSRAGIVLERAGYQVEARTAQKPSANLASSLMRSGVQAGVKVILGYTASTPSSSPTNSSICSAT